MNQENFDTTNGEAANANPHHAHIIQLTEIGMNISSLMEDIIRYMVLSELTPIKQMDLESLLQSSIEAQASLWEMSDILEDNKDNENNEDNG